MNIARFSAILIFTSICGADAVELRRIHDEKIDGTVILDHPDREEKVIVGTQALLQKDDFLEARTIPFKNGTFMVSIRITDAAVLKLKKVTEGQKLPVQVCFWDNQKVIKIIGLQHIEMTSIAISGFKDKKLADDFSSLVSPERPSE